MNASRVIINCRACNQRLAVPRGGGGKVLCTCGAEMLVSTSNVIPSIELISRKSRADDPESDTGTQPQQPTGCPGDEALAPTPSQKSAPSANLNLVIEFFKALVPAVTGRPLGASAIALFVYVSGALVFSTVRLMSVLAFYGWHRDRMGPPMAGRLPTLDEMPGVLNASLNFFTDCVVGLLSGIFWPLHLLDMIAGAKPIGKILFPVWYSARPYAFF